MPQPQFQQRPQSTPIKNSPEQRVCSTCAGKVMLARIEPMDSGTDLRTYYCPVCAKSETHTIRYTNPTAKGPERRAP
jgi:hypothetical protein